MDRLAQQRLLGTQQREHMQRPSRLSVPLGVGAQLVICLSLNIYVRYRRQRSTMLKNTFHLPE
jgi:hypothetical protein